MKTQAHKGSILSFPHFFQHKQMSVNSDVKKDGDKVVTGQKFMYLIRNSFTHW